MWHILINRTIHKIKIYIYYAYLFYAYISFMYGKDFHKYIK